MNRCDTLAHFRQLARRQHLTVWQYLVGHVHGHAPGSLHYVHCGPGSKAMRAFDAYAPLTTRGKLRMARYARYMRKHHKHELTEFIYNGRFTKVSIADGRDVPPSHWGEATWLAHSNHCHCAV